MSNRLSHSAASKYQLCGEAYRLHYREKLRERNTSAALLFGSAIDEALNFLLEKNSLPIAKKAFVDQWLTGFINGKKINTPDSIQVVYAAADYDPELLIDDDIEAIEAKQEALFGDMTEWQERYKQCVDRKKSYGKDNMAENEVRYMNFVNWHCLKRKGLLMLDAYNAYIKPKIKRVISVQKKIELANDGGDTVVGVIDMICEWDDGSIIVFDHKTAAFRYDDDAVVSKPQLPLYVFHTKLEMGRTDIKAGYIIFLKGINKNRIKICSVCMHDGTGARHKTCANDVDGKRCGGEWTETIEPKCDVQLLIDTIPDKVIDMVVGNMDDINNAIANNIFTKNLNTCKNMFGGPCPYYKKCWNDDESNLDRVER